MPAIPGYWKNETAGVLRPSVEAYLAGNAMTAEDITAMRAYLRQWMLGDWRGPGVSELRAGVGKIADRESLEAWLRDAAELEIDPL